MFFKSKHAKELESIIYRLEANMSNNYKDNAQSNLKELISLYDQLVATNKLSEKDKLKYADKIKGYSEKMEGFTHKDQKPYWV